MMRYGLKLLAEMRFTSEQLYHESNDKTLPALSSQSTKSLEHIPKFSKYTCRDLCIHKTRKPFYMNDLTAFASLFIPSWIP